MLSYKRKRIVPQTSKKHPKQDAGIFPAPMDAFSYDAAKVKFPVLIQPKMDGCRIRIANIGWQYYVLSANNIRRLEWSRLEAMMATFNLPLNHMVEGEFYVHDVSWQKLNGLFRRKKDPFNPTNNDASPEVHLFDIFPLSGASQPYKYRLKQLNDLFKAVDPSKYMHTRIKLVKSWKCENDEDVQKYYKDFLSKGYEGAMIKDLNAAYVSSRSHAVMKLKPWEDAEFKIVDLLEASYGVHTLCEDPNDPAIRFGARWDMHAEKAKTKLQKKEQYIGLFATIKFTARTDKGVPRTPMVKGIRYDLQKQQEE